MDLFHLVRQTPLLRPNAFPNSLNTAIFCLAAALDKIPSFLLQNAKAVFVVNHNPRIPETILFPISGNPQNEIPIYPLAELAKQISFDIIFFHHVYDYGPLASCAHYAQRVGFNSFFNCMPIPYNCGITTRHIPNYYSNHKKELDRVFDILEDDESKQVFASRIRAVESGNVGYMRVSLYSEYFHPLVKPEKGDVVVDGGVSESIGAQIQMSNAVGETGKIYGFEPDPVGFSRATDNLKSFIKHNNYKLIPLGLWHKKDYLFFRIAGQGTHVSATNDSHTVKCSVISIDEFIAINHIPKVSLIKLDVEGAEINALKGAIKTIETFKPKLAISLYHTDRDLYHIPRLIHELSDRYKFYMGHHHASLHETILYATCNDN